MQWAFRVAVLSCVLFAGCVAATSNSMLPTNAPNGALEQIPFTLLKPDGAGPFPAVAIMHDCSGLGPRSSGAPLRWARELVEDGYVIVIPDSFSTRGHPGGVCTDASPSRNSVAPRRRAFDAYAALAYLRTQSYVDGSRVGIMGGSHGGSTTLSTITAPERPKDPLAQEKRRGFSAAVALYPGCAPYSGGYQATAPLMILIGENDDWTPAEPCRNLTQIAQRVGLPVSIKVYPGAHHAFDSNFPARYDPARINANAPTGRGATTGGDPKAWDDAVSEVKSFFARYLKAAAK
ncbi:MAG: dienelactone hydrolase family protein [Deltaproteobacteria bacterium]|nr:dienelactone hydrolase family protein [Deltaproteobacteria bacterium]